MLGGTFDPIHLGHLACAREVAEALALQRTLLVLSARPPHKRDGSQADAAQRWAMLLLATESDPVLEASDVELKRTAPSYTVDTLEALAADNPRDELYLILGVDAYLEIDTWHRPERLLELANVVVTTRPGHAFPDDAPSPPVAAADACCYDPTIACHVHRSGHRLIAHRIRGREVSASRVRSRLRDGLAIDDLTGPSVARYIRDHGLYGASRP